VSATDTRTFVEFEAGYPEMLLDAHFAVVEKGRAPFVPGFPRTSEISSAKSLQTDLYAFASRAMNAYAPDLWVAHCLLATRWIDGATILSHIC
jgi:hypothetical protein